MATAQLSPGVESFEQDFTAIVPSFSTTAAAIAGVFDWGPVNEPFRVSNELEFVNTFGKPNDSTANYAFSAINFLAYGNNLLVNRASLTTARNASGATAAVTTGTLAVIQGEPDVVGTGTAFQTELAVGDKITFVVTGTTYAGYVKTITSNTVLTLEGNSAVTASDLTFTATKKVVVKNSADSVIAAVGVSVSCQGLGHHTLDCYSAKKLNSQLIRSL